MMVDFSKWVEAWNSYSPSHKITPGSPAYICNEIGVTLAMLGLAVAGQEESSTETEDKSSDTAIFTVQVEKEFGVRNLSCPAKVMDATSDLPHKGVYQCSVTYDENYANLRNVTLVVADGNKVGLYDAQGKALK